MTKLERRYPGKTHAPRETKLRGHYSSGVLPKDRIISILRTPSMCYHEEGSPNKYQWVQTGLGL